MVYTCAKKNKFSLKIFLVDGPQTSSSFTPSTVFWNYVEIEEIKRSKQHHSRVIIIIDLWNPRNRPPPFSFFCVLRLEI